MREHGAFPNGAKWVHDRWTGPDGELRDWWSVSFYSRPIRAFASFAAAEQYARGIIRDWVEREGLDPYTYCGVGPYVG